MSRMYGLEAKQDLEAHTSAKTFWPLTAVSSWLRILALRLEFMRGLRG